MKKLEYQILIDASPVKVWDVLLGEKTYPQWTSPFSPDSRVETDWQKGNRALFTDGSNNGMISEIAENIPAQYLSIRHLGSIINGVEDYDSEETKSWAGSHENYILRDAEGATELRIEIDVAESHIEMFDRMWPEALQKVKELSENQ